MSIRRIAAVILTHQYKFADKTEWLELLYWWGSSTLVVGFLGRAFAATTGNVLLSMATVTLITIARPTMRGSATIMAQLLVDQLSGRIFLSTMGTPVSTAELTTAYAISAATLGTLRVGLGYFLLFLFFGPSLLVLGWTTVLIIPFLLLTGLTLGLFTSAFVYTTGKRSHRQLQIIGESLIAICGAYAPTAALPPVFQTITRWIPAAYVFDGARAQVLEHASIWPFLLKSLALNAVYAIIGVTVLYLAVRHAKNRGLAYLENK